LFRGFAMVISHMHTLYFNQINPSVTSSFSMPCSPITQQLPVRFVTSLSRTDALFCCCSHLSFSSPLLPPPQPLTIKIMHSLSYIYIYICIYMHIYDRMCIYVYIYFLGLASTYEGKHDSLVSKNFKNQITNH
jgi:hypothetical protein